MYNISKFHFSIKNTQHEILGGNENILGKEPIVT